MTINEIVAKFNGETFPATEWWPETDPCEMIAELPQSSVWWQFEQHMNAVLCCPIQYIADSNNSRFFLYHTT